MRSTHRFHPLAEVGARRVAPLEAISRTEKVIAFCRVILATTTLAVVVADSRSPVLGNLVVGRGRGYTQLELLIAGLVGSVVGGTLFSLLLGEGFDLRLGGFIGSTVGAIIVLALYGPIRDRTRRA